jgi:hypothetical protein
MKKKDKKRLTDSEKESVSIKEEVWKNTLKFHVTIEKIGCMFELLFSNVQKI